MLYYILATVVTYNGKAVVKTQARRPAKSNKHKNRNLRRKGESSMKVILLIVSFLFWQFSFAQKLDSIYQKLDTIILSGFFTSQNIEIKDYSPLVQKKIYKLSSTPSLKELLEFNSDIFFKEYGRGMLSSISIRGTGASHTLVLWNGLPINSKLNGQVDFNSIYSSGISSLRVKKGGESVLFGSGAIGGIIEINNPIVFKNEKEIYNSFHYGSFTSVFNQTHIKLSNRIHYFALDFTTNYSKNDYVYPDKNQRNSNGQYTGYDFQVEMGKKINPHNILTFHSHYNLLGRNLSGTLYAPSQSKLKTSNSQYLVGWKNDNKIFDNSLSVGYLSEMYDYYPNKDNPESSLSQSQNFVIKNESKINIPRMQISLGNLYEKTWAKGKYIASHRLQSLAIYANVLYQFNKFSMQSGIRKEFHSSFSIPLLVRFKLDYMHHTNEYSLKSGISWSSNYKVPTLNDLYWNPGGNPDLKPEDSQSIEAFIKYQNSAFHFQLTGFYIHSQNLIKWVPFTSSLWKPINFEEVISKGIEMESSKKFRLSSAAILSLRGSYTYQYVLDTQNNKLLPYIPMQTALLSLDYKQKFWELLLTGKYTGKIYTTKSNTLSLASHQIINIKSIYKFNRTFTIGGGINNIFNVYYESFPSRPQPGRNYYINIQIKINKS